MIPAKIKLIEIILIAPIKYSLDCPALNKVAKADAAAEKAREAILNHEKKEATSRRKKVLKPEKFKDCEKHGENSTLIITEGNSALAGLNPARNVETDALYAVRGKIKNLLKHPVEECLENQEVSDIITLLGCGIMDKYNSKKLNYGKVAIASDGDIDGLNIMCLVATLFMVLIPDFVKEGRLCWLRAPLYRIGVGNKRYYAYNDEELKNYQSQFPKAEVGRYKGLGEMRPEDVEESMFQRMMNTTGKFLIKENVFSLPKIKFYRVIAKDKKTCTFYGRRRRSNL